MSVAGGSRYGVEVRAAVAADAPEVGRLLGLTAIVAADRLSVLRSAPGTVLAATGWNALAGLVAVQWWPSLDRPRLSARLTALLVDPSDRRRGIGRMLLKAASQAARAAGCDQIEIGMTGGEDGLLVFCEANGFAVDQRLATRSLRKRGAGEE